MKKSINIRSEIIKRLSVRVTVVQISEETVIMMKVVLIFVSQILLSQGVVFDGACPDIKGIEDFQCSQNLKATTYKVMAHLPCDSSTLNMFYSPYDSIDCLTYQLSCSYTSDAIVNGKLLCTPWVDREYGSYYMWQQSLQCLPITINMSVETSTDVNQIQSFGLALQLQCPDMLADFKISIITSEKGFVILYGCRDINSGSQHDEGMFLLFPQSDVAGSYESSFFDEALQLVVGTSATVSNFGIAQYDKNVTCACVDCNYMYSCPVTAVTASVDDYYYQFKMPDRQSNKKTPDDYYKNDYYAYQYPDYYNYDSPKNNGTVTDGSVSLTSDGTVVTVESLVESDVFGKFDEGMTTTEVPLEMDDRNQTTL